MKKTVKVVLLSILVFPGVGHLVLKKYVIAAAFIASFVYLLLGLFNQVMNKTQPVIDAIIQGEIPIELTAIRQALIEQGVLESSEFSTMGFLLLLIWAIAAFDAYRIANKSL